MNWRNQRKNAAGEPVVWGDQKILLSEKQSGHSQSGAEKKKKAIGEEVW